MKVSRLFQKERYCRITLRVTKVGAAVEQDSKLQVVWIRGDKKDVGEGYDVNEYDPDADCFDVFEKASSFFSKDKGVTFEPKLCNF